MNCNDNITEYYLYKIVYEVKIDSEFFSDGIHFTEYFLSKHSIVMLSEEPVKIFEVEKHQITEEEYLLLLKYIYELTESDIGDGKCNLLYI